MLMCLRARALLLLACISVSVSAQTIPPNAVAVVNGQAISQDLFDQLLRANVAQGLKDSPQLRQAIKDDLINRVLLIQRAEKLGLDKTPEAQVRLQALRENLLVESLMADYLKRHPITEDMIQADYDRQVETLKKAGKVEQYQLSVIVVPSEAEANDILYRLKRGISFSALARERSVDPSKANDGVVGWVLPAQINPALVEAMTKLKKGAYAGPIATGEGWSIIRVDDKRPFKMPTLEESKNGIIALLIQQRRLQLIEQLRAESRISR